MVASPLTSILSWWEFVNNCCSGRRTRAKETFTGPALPPGTRLRATDRSYEVTASGAWVRCGGVEARPASQSQIRALPRRSRGKYPKNSAAQTATPFEGGDAGARIPTPDRAETAPGMGQSPAA